MAEKERWRMTEPFKIVQGKSDKDIADDLRERMIPALQVLCDLMREADFSGMQTSFNIARDQYGKLCVQALNIVKVL